MLKPLVLFWGLVTIREFAYRFSQSVAKYELMMLDIPRTDYNKKDKPTKPSDSNEERDIKATDPNDASIALNMESLRKLREAKAKKLQQENEGWTSVKLSELNTNE